MINRNNAYYNFDILISETGYLESVLGKYFTKFRISVCRFFFLICFCFTDALRVYMPQIRTIIHEVLKFIIHKQANRTNVYSCRRIWVLVYKSEMKTSQVKNFIDEVISYLPLIFWLIGSIRYKIVAAHWAARGTILKNKTNWVTFHEIVGRLVGFYGISTFLGYLTPNPFLCK